MSSSDSEDCYGNIAQKLQLLKKQCAEDKCPTGETLTDVAIVNTPSTKTDVNTIILDDEECNVSIVSLNNTENDEMTLDAIIAKNTKPKRGRKRKIKTIETVSTGRTSIRKTANSNKTNDINIVIDARDTSANTVAGRGRRGKVGRTTSTTDSATTSTPLRGRSRGSRGYTPPRRRGRGRNRRNTSRRGWYMTEQVDTYPVYSIGNTDEYPDMCDNQELFSTNPSNSNDVEIVEEDPLANDNEELSVKVYWQSLEVVRFKIRKYQKLTSVFKYFSDRDNVEIDKLLFMYNDRILKVDDTPDSIDYSIAKFIEGGIVEQKVTGILKVKSLELEEGLKIKFQCQNIKKPFETTVRPEDKLALAMMKCAEHLETALERLKFFFDGDLISSKNTAQELDLEGGECIDVKIISL